MTAKLVAVGLVLAFTTAAAQTAADCNFLPCELVPTCKFLPLTNGATPASTSIFCPNCPPDWPGTYDQTNWNTGSEFYGPSDGEVGDLNVMFELNPPRVLCRFVFQTWYHTKVLDWRVLVQASGSDAWNIHGSGNIDGRQVNVNAASTDLSGIVASKIRLELRGIEKQYVGIWGFRSLGRLYVPPPPPPSPPALPPPPPPPTAPPPLTDVCEFLPLTNGPTPASSNITCPNCTFPAGWPGAYDQTNWNTGSEFYGPAGTGDQDDGIDVTFELSPPRVLCAYTFQTWWVTRVRSWKIMVQASDSDAWAEYGSGAILSNENVVRSSSDLRGFVTSRVRLEVRGVHINPRYRDRWGFRSLGRLYVPPPPPSPPPSPPSLPSAGTKFITIHLTVAGDAEDFGEAQVAAVRAEVARVLNVPIDSVDVLLVGGSNVVQLQVSSSATEASQISMAMASHFGSMEQAHAFMNRALSSRQRNSTMSVVGMSPLKMSNLAMTAIDMSPPEVSHPEGEAFEHSNDGSSGLGVGAGIGIGIACGFAGLLLVALAYYFCSSSMPRLPAKSKEEAVKFAAASQAQPSSISATSATTESLEVRVSA